MPCQVTQVFKTQLLVIQFTIKMFHTGFMQVIIETGKNLQQPQKHQAKVTANKWGRLVYQNM